MFTTAAVDSPQWASLSPSGSVQVYVNAAIELTGALPVIPYVGTLTLSTTLTRDFYLAVLNKNATDKQQLRFSKWAIVGIGVIATFLGIYANSILTQVNGAFQIRAVAGMVLVIAAYWKKVDKNSAFWSMLIGGIVAAVWHFAGQPFGIVPFWPGCGTGLVILVVMTALNGKKVSDDYARYKALMDAVPANEL